MNEIDHETQARLERNPHAIDAIRDGIAAQEHATTIDGDDESACRP